MGFETGNPLIEQGSVEGTLENVVDAVESVRFALGEMGGGRVTGISDRVCWGFFKTLQSVENAVDTPFPCQNEMDGWDCYGRWFPARERVDGRSPHHSRPTRTMVESPSGTMPILPHRIHPGRV